MRIDELVIERYGHFADRRLTFRPDAKLHVVLGANEAGKTTALAAISDLLFGFQHQTPYDFRHEARSLRLGARLTLRNGETLAFRRRKGRERTLVDANDAALPDDLLAPVLGAVTREMFQGEFGLTAQALRDGGRELARAGGRMSEALAASSAGMGALSHLRARFAREADDLFTARRVASKPFYAALDAHHAADVALKQALVTTETWAGAVAAVREAEERSAAAKAELERLGGDLARLERIGRVSGKLAALDAARAELAAVATPALDAAAIAAAREALRRSVEIAAQRQKLDEDDADDAAKRARLRLDPKLLARSDAIDGLRQRVGEIRKSLTDLPRRQGEQRELAEGLERAAQALGLADSAALSARQPSAPALAQVRAMIGDGRAAQKHVDVARAALEGARADLERRENAPGAPAHAGDPEPLQQRLALFDDLPADCDQARREAAACAAERSALEEAFAALTPRPATLQALAAAPLLDRSRVEAAMRAFDRQAEADRDHALALAGAEDAARKIDAELSRLAAAGASATRDDLDRLRAERDAALAGLRSADDDTARRDMALAHLGGVVHHIDLVTDVLLAAGERLTLLQNAAARRAEAERHIADLVAAGRARAEQRATLVAKWRALWAQTGLTPDDPAAMAPWLDRTAGLRGRREELARREAALAAQEARIEAARPHLAALCADLGLPARDLPPDLAFREARAALTRFQKLWTERREGEARRAAARDAVEKAEANLARAEDALRQWREAWPDALAEIALGPGANPAAAEAALDLWQSALMQEREHRKLTQRVDSMLRDIAQFEADVVALCVGEQAPLATRPALDALEAMTGELAAARDAGHRARALDEAARTRAANRAALDREYETARSVVAATRGRLALQDRSSLEAALDAAARRLELQDEIDRARADFVAEGRDEAALRDEAEGVDRDALPAMLETRAADRRRLMQELEAAGAALSAARARRDDLEAGHDADAALTRRVEAANEVETVARRYLARAVAARLAARAVERYRASIESPVIARAARMFAEVTGGAFRGLRPEYSDAGAVLVGQRGDGATILVENMSEGARDQLFLTLRLALLETRGAEPLPFIGDDLLASFDDARAARMLDLLAAIHPDQQVILFTHHAHVAELARGRRSDSIEIVEL